MTATFEFKGTTVTVEYDYDPGRGIQFNNIEDASEPMSLEISEITIETVANDGGTYFTHITSFLDIDGFKDELEKALLKEIDPVRYRDL